MPPAAPRQPQDTTIATGFLHLRGGQRLAQLPLHDFAIGIARQRIRCEHDGLRHLVIGQPFGAPRAQRYLADRTASGHDHGVNALAEDRTRFGDDGALDHRRMAREHGLDFGGIDLEPAPVDHVFLTIEHPHEVSRIDRTEIARMPVARRDTLGGGARVVPVAFDDRTAVNPYLADLAAWQFATG